MVQKILKKFGSLALICILLFGTVCIGAAGSTEDAKLQFHNGKFKILVLSDVQDTNTPQKETTALVNAAIDRAQPDFIVLLGDNTAGWWKGVDKAQTEAAIDAVAKPIDERGIPFALVFGNHDHEGLCDEANGMTEEEAKEFILARFQTYKNCLAVEGEELTGVGNYNLPILNSAGDKAVFNLWFMDSNPYAPEEEGGGYGYVHEDQTAWYQRTADALKAENGGQPLPSLLFQHIIVPEAYEMFNTVKFGTKGAVRGNSSFHDKWFTVNPEYVYEGELNEGPCSPNTNHGQFESWLTQGDIIGAFFGHDHVNDFAGVYKGIHLVACPAVTFYSYGNHRGVRTITLDEADLTKFDSEILSFDELTGLKVYNLYKKNHGYIEYKNNFLPAFFGGLAVIAVLTVGGICLKKYLKKRKNK